MYREERTGDREHIQVFHQYNGTPEEEAESLELVISSNLISTSLKNDFQYKKVCSTLEIPISFTINYGQTVLTGGRKTMLHF